MAVTKQNIQLGGKSSIRIGIGALTGGSDTEIQSFTRYNPGSTTRDIVSAGTYSPTYGDIPEDETVEYTLRGGDVIQTKSSSTNYDPLGATIANADNPDTVEFTFAFSTDDKILLQTLRTDQTPLLVVIPGLNEYGVGINSTNYILGNISGLAEAEDGIGDMTVTITGAVATYTAATGLTSAAINTALALGTGGTAMFSWGEDDGGSGYLPDGLSESDSEATRDKIFQGGIVTLKQA